MILQLVQSGATLNGGTYSLFWVAKPEVKNGYYLLEMWKKTRNGKAQITSVKGYANERYMRQHLEKIRRD